jgi:uncharacterized protein YbaA (DUF1428 family)
VLKVLGFVNAETLAEIPEYERVIKGAIPVMNEFGV